MYTLFNYQPIKILFFFFLFKYNTYLFFFFFFAALGFSCGVWDLVPQPGIKSKPTVLAQSLSHWTTREVLTHLFIVFHDTDMSEWMTCS